MHAPAGMNKMVINHLEKLFVTSDASTIINELEVEHPAAKLLVLAAKAQEQEIGDGTNFVRRRLHTQQHTVERLPGLQKLEQHLWRRGPSAQSYFN